MSSVSSVASSSSSYWEEVFSTTKSQKGQKKEDDLATALFSDLDTDGNKGLSLQETGLDQETYDSMDTDGDGTLSLAELQNALELQRKAAITQMKLQELEPFYSQLSETQEDPDAPGAQELLKGLMSGANRQLANGAADDTGVVFEMSGASGAAAAASQQVEDSDFDSEEEKTYDSMDLNQDGVVDARELAVAMGTFGSAAKGDASKSASGVSAALTSPSMKNAFNLMGEQRNATSQGLNMVA